MGCIRQYRRGRRAYCRFVSFRRRAHERRRVLHETAISAGRREERRQRAAPSGRGQTASKRSSRFTSARSAITSSRWTSTTGRSLLMEEKCAGSATCGRRGERLICEAAGWRLSVELEAVGLCISTRRGAAGQRLGGRGAGNICSTSRTEGAAMTVIGSDGGRQHLVETHARRVGGAHSGAGRAQGRSAPYDCRDETYAPYA